MGIVTINVNGKTVYKDGQERIQLTVTTGRNGKTSCRDAQGRIQATKNEASRMLLFSSGKTGLTPSILGHRFLSADD